MQLAQNEMRANCAMPERVGSNEGLGRIRCDGDCVPECFSCNRVKT